MRMYKVIRFYINGRKRIMKKNLTLAEAQAHCRDPKTRKEGVFFDGYAEMGRWS